MLCKHTPETIIEVLAFALARKLIVGHTPPLEDLITVAPDSMFDDEEIKDAKLTDLSTVFQNKIKYMTIQNIIDWGNISTLNPTVLSIIGEATLEDFFASLSYEDGKINVDIVILYVNIYARQNETV